MTTQKTRCPYCSSVFAVSNAQLAIRDGYTRCGKCFQVFKADDYLLTNKATDSEKSTSESNAPATLPQNTTRSHIVDLHKIDSTKSKAFDKASDNSLEQKKLPLPSIIDFEHTKKKEKLDLSLLPNEHPEPEQKTPAQLDPDAYLATEIEEPSEKLNHEFNEQWLAETANPTNPLAQSKNRDAKSNEDLDTNPTESTSESNEPMTDDDLMSYLNKNTAPASRLNTKTERNAQSMNDFHANQRSKKNTTAVPMHIDITKRNQALDRLTGKKSFFSKNFAHILGWSFASLFMVALLVGQYIFFNFDHLAANPKYQPIMHKACLTLGCDVPLIDLEKIKISNIVAGPFQPSPSDSTIVTASITNGAEESQPYPNLRFIVLKDRKVLSGRILHPYDYLKSGYNAQARLPVKTPTQIEFVLKIPRNEIPVFALDPVQ